MTLLPPPPPPLPELERSSPVDQQPDAVVLGEKEQPGSERTKARITLPELEGGKKVIHVTGRVKALLNGEISVADLDDEELQRGQVRDKNGNFSGRPSSIVPRKFHDEIVRRLLGRGDELYREHYLKMIEVFTSIAMDTTAKDADRLKAADMVITRIAGKVPDKVELTAQIKPWESMLQGIVQPDDQIEVTVAKAEQIEDAVEVGQFGDEVVLPVAEEEQAELVDDSYYMVDDEEEAGDQAF